jgi:hypothetical protein
LNCTQGHPIHPRIGRGSQPIPKYPNTKNQVPALLARSNADYPEFKFEAQLRPDRRYYARARNLPEDYYLKSVAISGHDVPPGSYRLLALESVNLDSEINDPDFLRTIGNRGQAMIVEESGKYTVSLKLESGETRN